MNFKPTGKITDLESQGETFRKPRPFVHFLRNYWPLMLAAVITVGGYVGIYYGMLKAIPETDTAATIVRNVITSIGGLLTGGAAIGLTEKIDDIRQRREANRRADLRMALYAAEQANKRGITLEP